MSYVLNGGWRLDWAGEYQLGDVIVVYDRSNDSIGEFVNLRRTPVDLNVLVSGRTESLVLRRQHYGSSNLAAFHARCQSGPVGDKLWCSADVFGCVVVVALLVFKT